MFDLLKKKISGFVEKIGGAEEKPSAPPKEKKVEKKSGKKEIPPKIEIKKKAKVEEKKVVVAKPKEKTPKITERELPKEKKVEPAPVEVKKGAKPTKEKEKKQIEEIKEPVEISKVKTNVEGKEPKKKTGIIEKLLGSKKEEEKPEIKEITKEEEKVEVVIPPKPSKKEVPAAKEEQAKKKEEELKKKVKKGLFASVTETITGESEVKESEIVELLDELELGMLESDVALSVAEEIKEELRKRIIGSKVKRGQTAIFVKDSLNDILLKMFQETPGFDIVQKIEGREKPCRIMVVGPNGAGKTTTIAKIVALLQSRGLKVCVAASDTFRAAAVEQLVHHGNKLGINVVHGAYGSDPTSIAFDAVNYAKANNLDVVLIDTAGRQETNVNLLNQLKKMDRIIKPDFKIYVGESIAGNAMVEQISRFNGDIGLDGVILTKLDCDAKGGTVISVSRVAKLPILYVGVGQGYGDLKPFVAEEIVGEILS